MDKIKSLLKGDKDETTSHSHSSHTTGNTGSTTSNVAREAEQAVSGHHSSTTGTTGTSSTYDSTTAPSSTGRTTEVYEDQDQVMNAPVAHETVKRTQHEDVQELRDVERHQDHYHTTVQPLVDRQVDPTVEKSRQAEVQYSEHEHDDAARTRAALEAQSAQFQNTRTDNGVTKTHRDLGAVESQTVHNHMHEVVQPVIEREIIQPSTVHTTIPVKEVHHEAAHIHEATTAPPMTVDEFSRVSGGVAGADVSGTGVTGSRSNVN